MRIIILLAFAFTGMNVNAQQVPQTNQHFSHTTTTPAAPQSVWNVWTDVANWKLWDTGLKDASMSERFELGAKGTITSLEGRKSKFKIVEYNHGISYTMKTKLPLGSLYVKRYLKTENGLTTFTHEVWFKGLTRAIFAKAFGSKFKKLLPEVLENIREIVEE